MRSRHASKMRASPGVEQLATELAPDGTCEARLRQFLEFRVWPTIPAEARRKWSRDEEDAILGYGEFGESV